MKHLVLLLVLTLVLLPRANGEPSESADTIFLNGDVYTVNDAQPQAEAIAIKGDRILFVGSNDDARKYSGPATRTTDLRGKTVVPGLTDSHYHIFEVGERLTHLNLESASSLEMFLAKVKEQTEKAGPGKWITGRGWIETFWTPPVFPTRQELDKVAPANPVFLERADGHGAVVEQQGAEDCRNRCEDAQSIWGRNLARQKNRRSRLACYSTTRWSWSRRKSRLPHRKKTRELFCLARNARSLSAGARSKTPEAICPRWS